MIGSMARGEAGHKTDVELLCGNQKGKFGSL